MDNTAIGDSQAIAQAIGLPDANETPAVEPSQAEEQKDSEINSPEPKEEQNEELREVKRKAQESHKQVIDLIEEKFKQLDSRRLTDEELRTWFNEHPELSDVANRSKRVKDNFRSLMERSPEVRRGDATLPEEVKEEEEAKQELTYDKSVNSKPLTIEDLRKYDEEREARLLEQLTRREREKQAEDYAVSRNIKDENYTKLTKNAEALFKANDDWEYSQALEAAHRAIVATKGEGTNLANANSIKAVSDAKIEKLDFTKGVPLMSWDEITGNKR